MAEWGLKRFSPFTEATMKLKKLSIKFFGALKYNKKNLQLPRECLMKKQAAKFCQESVVVFCLPANHLPSLWVLAVHRDGSP